MATKRGEKSKHELVNLGYTQKKDEVIERLILSTDSLQGIALLYNTSVRDQRLRLSSYWSWKFFDVEI